MNKFEVIIATLLLTAGGLQAGVVTNVGSEPTGTLTGLDNVDARQSQVARSSSQSLAIGQSFTLATLPAAADYNLTDIYLKSASVEDWDKFAGNMQIKVFSDTQGSATLLGTYSYDLNAAGDGTTNSDVSNDEWVKFGLDTGLTLDDGGTYSFLVYFDTQDDDHNWGFRRNRETEGYVDGNQFGDTTYDANDWTSNPWTGITPDVYAKADLAFHVAGTVSGNLPPTADDISKVTLKNNSASITLSGSDINDDPLTFTATSPSNGTLTGTSPDLTYTPNTDYVGADSFTYTAHDGTTNSEPATVSITVLASSGLMVSVGTNDPAVVNANLVGTSDEGASREIIRSDTQTFVIGQSFTLAERKTVTELYLQSASGEDFSTFDGGVEIKVFSGEGASATLLHTTIFDGSANDQGGGAEVVNGEWVQFTLQGGGVSLPAGANSFLVFWTQKGGGNKWGFKRNKTNAYSGGMQYELVEQSGDAYPQWDMNPWDSLVSIAANDLTFYVNLTNTVFTYTEIYEQWAIENGGNADMAVDTDFDGMDDLLEYALGANPTTNDAAIYQPSSGVAGGLMYYIYNRRDDAADRGLTYTVLSGTDLVSSLITNGTDYVGASPAVGGFQSATNSISTAIEGKQFMKLKIELAD